MEALIEKRGYTSTWKKNDFLTLSWKEEGVFNYSRFNGDLLRVKELTVNNGYKYDE